MKINCLDSLYKNYKGAKEKCCGSIFFLCRTVAMETIFRGQLAAIPVQHKKKKIKMLLLEGYSVAPVIIINIYKVAAH